MPTDPGHKTTIGMVLFPRLTQLDLTGPYEVFGRLPNTRVYLLARTLEPVRSEHGLSIVPDKTFADAPHCDILFVPGGAGVNPLMEDEAFLDFLRERAQQARIVTAVCTGSLLLAAAGLLDGHRATTHWMSLELLELFGVEAVPDRVVVDGNRITGGGVTSGVDFALVLAAQLYGENVAREIQLAMQYEPEPPFHSGTPQVADPTLVSAFQETRREFQEARRAIAERAAARLRARREKAR